LKETIRLLYLIINRIQNFLVQRKANLEQAYQQMSRSKKITCKLQQKKKTFIGFHYFFDIALPVFYIGKMA
jgi:hypothetical protein